jgi:hypothetical protein
MIDMTHKLNKLKEKRFMASYFTRLLVLLVLCYCAIGVAPANTIIVTRPAGAVDDAGYHIGFDDERLAVSWYQGLGAYDWEVRAFGLKSTIEQGANTMQFTLVRNAPDSTAPEDLIGSTPVTLPYASGGNAGFISDVQLFTGLYLQPGLYYLVVSAAGVGDGGFQELSWVQSGLSPQSGEPGTTAPWASFGPEGRYPNPTSGTNDWALFTGAQFGFPDFGVGFEVSAVTFTPEPGTLLLVGGVLVAAGCSRRRRRR